MFWPEAARALSRAESHGCDVIGCLLISNADDFCGFFFFISFLLFSSLEDFQIHPGPSRKITSVSVYHCMIANYVSLGHYITAGESADESAR